jgi:hypothetical protein
MARMDGDIFSRKGIDKGMVTLHPAGAPRATTRRGRGRSEEGDDRRGGRHDRVPAAAVGRPEAEKTSVEAYATSWARGLGLLDE